MIGFGIQNTKNTNISGCSKHTYSVSEFLVLVHLVYSVPSMMNHDN